VRRDESAGTERDYKRRPGSDSEHCGDWFTERVARFGRSLKRAKREGEHLRDADRGLRGQLGVQAAVQIAPVKPRVLDQALS